MSNLTTKDGEIKLKIGLVGETGVGKSCLLVRFVDNDFFEEADKYTLGVDFKVKNLKVDGKDIKLQIHDTAGTERFRTVTASFYRGAHGLFIVYDITSRESFTKVMDWLSETRKYTPDSTPIYLLGNKSDMKASRVVSFEEADEFATSSKMRYFETSAKDGSNVNDAFVTLVETIAKQKFQQPEDPPVESRRRRICTII